MFRFTSINTQDTYKNITLKVHSPIRAPQKSVTKLSLVVQQCSSGCVCPTQSGLHLAKFYSEVQAQGYNLVTNETPEEFRNTPGFWRGEMELYNRGGGGALTNINIITGLWIWYLLISIFWESSAKLIETFSNYLSLALNQWLQTTKP